MTPMVYAVETESEGKNITKMLVYKMDLSIDICKTLILRQTLHQSWEKKKKENRYDVFYSFPFPSTNRSNANIDIFEFNLSLARSKLKNVR